MNYRLLLFIFVLLWHPQAYLIHFQAGALFVNFLALLGTPRPVNSFPGGGRVIPRKGLRRGMASGLDFGDSRWLFDGRS